MPTQEFLIAEATDEVIVHQSSRLHVRIRDCWPDEAESPQLEILAQCLGFGGSRWNLSRSLPAASAQATSSVRPARLRARGPRSVCGRYEPEHPTRDRDIRATTDHPR